MEKLAQLIGSFSSQWEKEIRETAGFSDYKQAVDGIVDVRNKLAHGENVSIAFANVESDYKNILGLLELIEQLTTR